jgi:hypothetical protein
MPAWLPGSVPHDFLVWLWSVINSWAGWSTGGVIVLFVALKEIFHKPFSRRGSIVIAGCFLALALFSSWRSEYLKTAAGLRLHVEAIDVGDLQAGIAVIILGDVSNLGATPTIADNWHLKIISPDGEQLFDGTPLAILDGKPFSFNFGSTIYSYNPSDALYKKTVAPLPQGDKVTGFLVFAIPDTLKRQTIIRVGTRLVVYCSDVFGNEIHGEHTITGKRVDGWPYLPGINPPRWSLNK